MDAPPADPTSTATWRARAPWIALGLGTAIAVGFVVLVLLAMS